MLPNMTYKVNVEIECVDPTGANDLVKVIVMGPDSTLPLISANIQMPVSELNLDQF